MHWSYNRVPIYACNPIQVFTVYKKNQFTKKKYWNPLKKDINVLERMQCRVIGLQIKISVLQNWRSAD